MAIFRSSPYTKTINGNEITVSENAVVAEQTYTTNGETFLIVRGVQSSNIILDHKTTDRVVVKAMTNTVVSSEKLIDEEFELVEMTKGSCVEFKYIGEFWYILSSDGIKND